MKNYINKDLNKLEKKFFDNFLKNLQNIKKEQIFIGLSGGSSVLGFYNYIKINYLQIPEKIRSRIIFCFLDERIVPLDNINSNYKLLKDDFLGELLNKKLITDEQIIKIELNNNNIAGNYNNKVPKMDIGLFGVGPDGHTCSLFPNHKLLENENIEYLTINDSPKPPLNRITISKNMFPEIDYGYIFFIGNGKREALNNFLNENIDYKECPAKLVNNCKESFLFSNLK